MVENRIGAVAELTRLLAESAVNIESMSVEACGSSGAAIISVDHYDYALKVLSDAGFEAISGDALVVRIDDQPGALAHVAARFEQQHIDIRSMRFLCRDAGVAFAALVTSNNADAEKLVEDILVG